MKKERRMTLNVGYKTLLYCIYQLLRSAGFVDSLNRVFDGGAVHISNVDKSFDKEAIMIVRRVLPNSLMPSPT